MLPLEQFPPFRGSFLLTSQPRECVKPSTWAMDPEGFADMAPLRALAKGSEEVKEFFVTLAGMTSD